MGRKPLTFRADEALADELTNLSRVLHRPVNKLITDAVRLYLQRRSLEVERELESQVTRLRAYRRSDPHFEEAIEAFADAETRPPGGDDGAVRREIRNLLGG